MIKRLFPSLSADFRRALAMAVVFAGILALVVLAASLANLDFFPGFQMRPLERNPGSPGRIFEPPDWSVLQAMLLIFGALVFISILLVLIDKEARKKLTRSIGFVLLYIAAFLFFYYQFSDQLPPPPEEEPLETAPAPEIELDLPEPEADPLPAPEINAPEIPGWVGYVLTLAGVSGVGWLGYRYRKKSRRKELSLQEITASALSELTSGRAWDDVVIQCYSQMSSAAGLHGRGQRLPAMTPAEFSRRLERSGLPAQPVRSLTRLFEKARYGSGGSTTNEAEAAKACLRAILASLERQSDAQA